MLCPSGEIERLVAAASAAGRRSSCRAPAGHLVRPCSSLSCAGKMNHRCREFLALDPDAMEKHVAEAARELTGMDVCSPLVLPDDSRELLIVTLNELPTLMCGPHCQCECHACDDSCIPHGAILSSLATPPPDEGVVVSGPAWGLVSQDAHDVFIPALSAFQRLSCVADKVATRLRNGSGDWREYMEVVKPEDTQGVTYVGVAPPPADAPCAKVGFQAFNHQGAWKVHWLMVAAPADGARWTGILAADHTDGGRRLIFSGAFIRADTCTKHQLVAAARRPGYIFFICYLALHVRRTDPDQETMHAMCDGGATSTSSNTSARTRILDSYQRRVTQYILAAVNASGRAALLVYLRRARKAARSSSGAGSSAAPPTSKSRRLVRFDSKRNNQHLSNLMLYERVFCDISCADTYGQRAEHASHTRNIASTYDQIAQSDAAFRIVSELNRRAGAERLKRKVWEERVRETLVGTAKRLRAQGRVEEALNILTGASCVDDLPPYARELLGSEGGVEAEGGGG